MEKKTDHLSITLKLYWLKYKLLEENCLKYFKIPNKSMTKLNQAFTIFWKAVVYFSHSHIRIYLWWWPVQKWKFSFFFLFWNSVSNLVSIYFKIYLVQCNEMDIIRQIAVSFDQDQYLLFQKINTMKVMKVMKWGFIQLCRGLTSSQWYQWVPMTCGSARRSLAPFPESVLKKTSVIILSFSGKIQLKSCCFFYKPDCFGSLFLWNYF